jgi:hypothetical protein
MSSSQLLLASRGTQLGAEVGRERSQRPLAARERPRLYPGLSSDPSAVLGRSRASEVRAHR